MRRVTEKNIWLQPVAFDVLLNIQIFEDQKKSKLLYIFQNLLWRKYNYALLYCSSLCFHEKPFKHTRRGRMLTVLHKTAGLLPTVSNINPPSNYLFYTKRTQFVWFLYFFFYFKLQRFFSLQRCNSLVSTLSPQTVGELIQSCCPPNWDG